MNPVRNYDISNRGYSKINVMSKTKEISNRVKKPKLLLFDSYLAMIKNSEGTKIFRDFYGRFDKKKENLTKGGDLSCAFFVSAILYHFGLIKEPHLTVEGVLEDMSPVRNPRLLNGVQKSGWYKISRPRKGSIILWKERQGHRHLGFYLGNQKAISNNSKRRVPKIHHYTFNQRRKIEAIFWHKELN
jgi:hypothetical protein